VGGCVNRPTFFTDRTVSVYGVVNSWNWDFGDPTTVLDVSTLQNPTYQYPQTGTRSVRLIVTDSKGCRDTADKSITITTGPALSLSFRDTLICRNDNLILQATGSGTFSWSPAVNISDPTSPSPQVFPPVSTTYYVDLNAGGCTNRDSVRVSVVDFVTLIANDTTICSGDLTQLQIQSDGLQFSWTPAAEVSDPFVKNPFVNPATVSAFTVTAVIGGCTETKTMVVTPVPYPIANAGKDTAICYNSAALLQGGSDGSSWAWSAAQYVTNPVQLITSAQPPKTTAFILAAYDTRGCPKPEVDTVIITVLPRLKVNAGNDTAVVRGQPLQLNASGGVRFTWSPPVNLNNPDIADPIAVFNTASAGMQYMVTAFDSAGCSASDWIIIKIFQTGPAVFVPTAFTPNSDGLNDQLRPIGAGIKSIDYFNVYNRWGQLVFSTRHNGRGWDGRVNGMVQPTGTYVWSVSATDYLGKPYFQKGVFTLIR